MLLPFPFYPNTGDGRQCYQVAMQVVLKHFLGKDFSREELDALTERKTEFWTWTAQIVPVLHDLGLNVKFFSSRDPKDFLEGEAFIKRAYGDDAEIQLQMTDMPVLLNAVRRLINTDLYEHKTLEWPDIEEALQQGCVPLVLFNNTVMSERTGPFQGHFVTVTGFDDDAVFYHESRPFEPTPDRKVPKQRFIDAWMHPAADRDTVIVYGKRE